MFECKFHSNSFHCKTFSSFSNHAHVFNLQGNQSRLSLSSPSEEVLKPISNEGIISTPSKEVVKPPEEPVEILSDDEILETVEKEYFKELDFDPSRHELKVCNLCK